MSESMYQRVHQHCTGSLTERSAVKRHLTFPEHHAYRLVEVGVSRLGRWRGLL